MATYAVTTNLIIHFKVRVSVEADSAEEAINASADYLPNNFDASSQKGWGAKVSLKAPKGTSVEVVKATHFEHASGYEKARKIA